MEPVEYWPADKRKRLPESWRRRWKHGVQKRYTIHHTQLGVNYRPLESHCNGRQNHHVLMGRLFTTFLDLLIREIWIWKHSVEKKLWIDLLEYISAAGVQWRLLTLWWWEQVEEVSRDHLGSPTENKVLITNQFSNWKQSSPKFFVPVEQDKQSFDLYQWSISFQNQQFLWKSVGKKRGQEGPGLRN